MNGLAGLVLGGVGWAMTSLLLVPLGPAVRVSTTARFLS